MNNLLMLAFILSFVGFVTASVAFYMVAFSRKFNF